MVRRSSRGGGGCRGWFDENKKLVLLHSLPFPLSSCLVVRFFFGLMSRISSAAVCCRPYRCRWLVASRLSVSLRNFWQETMGIVRIVLLFFFLCSLRYEQLILSIFIVNFSLSIVGSPSLPQNQGVINTWLQTNIPTRIHSSSKSTHHLAHQRSLPHISPKKHDQTGRTDLESSKLHPQRH
jgi:hypothetical protein